jgi:hypothetical protein
MAVQLILETGAGVNEANTYTTVSHADQYLENSGRKAGAWSDAGNSGKQAALIQAFFYMLSRWRGRWKGFPTNQYQGGDWPQREQFYPSGHAIASNEIPDDLEHAQIEYAYAMLNAGLTELAPVPLVDDTGRVVTEATDKVDVLVQTRRYSDKGSASSVGSARSYPIADGLLSHYVTGGAVRDLLRN